MGSLPDLEVPPTPLPLSPFRCINGENYVALGYSISLALLVWVGVGLLKRVLYFFGNEPSLGQKSPILYLLLSPRAANSTILVVEYDFFQNSCNLPTILFSFPAIYDMLSTIPRNYSS